MNTMTLAGAYNWRVGSSDTGVVVDLYSFMTSLGVEIPFLPDVATAQAVEFYYYLSWSGDKIISPALEKIMEQFDDWTSTGARNAISNAFWKIHGEQLLRQWENFTREYDPIDDYDITEETDYSHSGSGSATDSGDDKRQKTGQVETTNDVWGINSTSGVDADRSTTVYGQGVNAPLEDKIVYGKSRATSESATDDLTIHKYGNLGINPISDFLKKDIDLWKMNFYKSIFFPALDSFLTIPIY